MSKKGIILFGHGARNPEWAEPFQRLREEMLHQSPDAEVSLAFLELMQPTLPEAIQKLVSKGIKEVSVVPVFISAGSHLREDLPKLADAAMQEHDGLRITIAPPLGEAPEVICAMASYALSGAKGKVNGLLASSDRLQRVMVAAQNGVWEYDLTTHRYSYLSQQAVRMLGAERSHQLLAEPAAARAAIHPEDLPGVIAAFKAHLLAGCAYDVEMRVRNADGLWFWVRSRGAVVRDADGHIKCMVGSLSDVNEARVATEALRRYQRLIRTVLDVIPEPVLVKDRNFKLLMINRAYAERAGGEMESLIGRDTREFMPEFEAERLVAADMAVLSTGRDQVFEISVPNRGQHMVRSYIATKRLAYDAEGQPIIVGIHHDVTDLKRSLAQFAAVIQETPLVAVQGFSRKCVVSHWNRASEEMFGVTRARAVGARLQELILDGRMWRPFEAMVEQAWAGKRAFGPREVQVHLKDGRRMWLLMTVFPVMQDGLVVEIFSMAVDVTARHQAERELAQHSHHLQEMVAVRTAGLLQATQELKAALRVKSEFLANMSHELRTPMHAILSFARLGMERAERSPPEKMREYSSRIVTSGERLLLLINDLLDLAKLEAGKMPLHFDMHDLGALVGDVASEFAALLQEKNLTMVLADGGKPWLCECDRARLYQVIANLVSNAIKFSPPGCAITVGLSEAIIPSGRRATDAKDCPAVLLSVTDCGPGVPEDELETIFDKFVQSTKTQTGAGGTGLGLAICQEIVSMHHGRISVYNRVQGGAVFEILLPLKVEHVKRVV